MLNQDQIEKKYKRELNKKKNEHNISQAESIKSSRVFDNLSSEISSSNKEINSQSDLENNDYSNYERKLERKLKFDKKNKKLELKKQAQKKIKKQAVDKVKKAVFKKFWVFIAPHLIYIIPILLCVIFGIFIILYISSVLTFFSPTFLGDEQSVSKEVGEEYDETLKEYEEYE